MALLASSSIARAFWAWRVLIGVLPFSTREEALGSGAGAWPALASRERGG